MPNMSCPDCGKEVYIDKLTMKVVNGEVVTPEAECECGGVMQNTSPKKGVPSLGRMNNLGQSY